MRKYPNGMKVAGLSFALLPWVPVSRETTSVAVDRPYSQPQAKPSQAKQSGAVPVGVCRAAPCRAAPRYAVP
jgi:hypothetical protein